MDEGKGTQDFMTTLSIHLPKKKVEKVAKVVKKKEKTKKYCKAKILRISNVGIMEINFNKIM